MAIFKMVSFQQTFNKKQSDLYSLLLQCHILKTRSMFCFIKLLVKLFLKRFSDLHELCLFNPRLQYTLGEKSVPE